MNEEWKKILAPFLESEQAANLRRFVANEYSNHIVYPQLNSMFTAFNLTPYDKVKVVILGQDPYHGPKQANGLAFSVSPVVQIPPSLRNIYKELVDDVGVEMPTHGDLTSWAKQGVLLMNTVLTVRAGQANSHRDQGWETLTDLVIKKLNEREKPCVFILWGRPAQQKIRFIDTNKHCVIKSPHPSPLSAYRGFFGSKPFSKANQALIHFNETPIDWSVPDYKQNKNEAKGR